MNVTILVGNGFDLNLNLKTKYTDFINDYCKSTAGDDDVIKKFKGDIKKDCETWANAELAFGQYTANFVDDESGAEKFCDCHDDFCEKLAVYLQRQESLINWNLPAQDIAKVFGGCISFSNLIAGLLETERTTIQKDMSHYGGGITYNFINFNYTKLLDRMIKETSGVSNALGERILTNGRCSNSFGKSYHVHGSTENDMVLGVNDESQIVKPAIFDDYGEEYKSDLIKQNTNEMNGANMDSKCERVIKESQFIYIYGMSIGETDALWWGRVVDLLMNHEDVHVVIHAYNAPVCQPIRRKFHTFCREERGRILSFCKSDEHITEAVENRIHIDPSNIFDDLRVFEISEEQEIINSTVLETV